MICKTICWIIILSKMSWSILDSTQITILLILRFLLSCRIIGFCWSVVWLTVWLWDHNNIFRNTLKSSHISSTLLFGENPKHLVPSQTRVSRCCCQAGWHPWMRRLRLNFANRSTAKSIAPSASPQCCSG